MKIVAVLSAWIASQRGGHEDLEVLVADARERTQPEMQGSADLALDLKPQGFEGSLDRIHDGRGHAPGQPDPV